MEKINIKLNDDVSLLINVKQEQNISEWLLINRILLAVNKAMEKDIDTINEIKHNFDMNKIKKKSRRGRSANWEERINKIQTIIKKHNISFYKAAEMLEFSGSTAYRLKQIMKERGLI